MITTVLIIAVMGLWWYVHRVKHELIREIRINRNITREEQAKRIERIQQLMGEMTGEIDG